MENPERSAAGRDGSVPDVKFRGPRPLVAGARAFSDAACVGFGFFRASSVVSCHRNTSHALVLRRFVLNIVYCEAPIKL